jgi:hypothetical protein
LFSIITIFLYRSGNGDDRFVGASASDESEKGVTSILQSVIWVRPKLSVMRAAKIETFLRFLRLLRSGVRRLRAPGSRTPVMTYRILCDTKVSLPVAVSSMGLSKSHFYAVQWSRRGSYCCSCFVQWDLGSDPAAFPNRDLHAEALRKKRKKRRKCPQGRRTIQIRNRPSRISGRTRRSKRW